MKLRLRTPLVSVLTAPYLRVASGDLLGLCLSVYVVVCYASSVLLSG